MNDANDATPTPLPEPGPAVLPLEAAVDLQDHLMTASNDLDRLQTLLADACDTLMQRFYGASEQIRALRSHPHTGEESDEVINGVMQDLGGAVTALQFQDMASQLVAHTQRRLRHCAALAACDQYVHRPADLHGSAHCIQGGALEGGVDLVVQHDHHPVTLGSRFGSDSHRI